MTGRHLPSIAELGDPLSFDCARTARSLRRIVASSAAVRLGGSVSISTRSIVPTPRLKW